MKNMGPVYAASILSSRVCTDAIILGQHDPYFLVLYKDGLKFFVYIVKKHYQAALSALAVWQVADQPSSELPDQGYTVPSSCTAQESCNNTSRVSTQNKVYREVRDFGAFD